MHFQKAIFYEASRLAKPFLIRDRYEHQCRDSFGQLNRDMLALSSSSTEVANWRLVSMPMARIWSWLGQWGSQNTSSWSWFLTTLRTAIPESSDMNLISDRDKGFLAADKTVYDNGIHWFVYYFHLKGVNQEITACNKPAQWRCLSKHNPLNKTISRHERDSRRLQEGGWMTQ